jgi:hypothetical protein
MTYNSISNKPSIISSSGHEIGLKFVWAQWGNHICLKISLVAVGHFQLYLLFDKPLSWSLKLELILVKQIFLFLCRLAVSCRANNNKGKLWPPLSFENKIDPGWTLILNWKHYKNLKSAHFWPNSNAHFPKQPSLCGPIVKSWHFFEK